MKRFIAVLTLVLLPVCLMAGLEGVALDILLYRGQPGNYGGYAEAVWSVNRGALAVSRSSSGNWVDTLAFELTFSSGERLADRATLRKIVEIPAGSMVTRDYLLFDSYGTELNPGRYELEFLARDLGDGDSLSITREFSVPRTPEGLFMSDLELLVDVSRDTSGGSFTVGGYRMLPNPARAFGISFPMLYASAEVYRSEKAGSLLITAYTVLDSSGDIFRSYPPDTVQDLRRDTRILNGFNVMGYPEGEYILRVDVRDPRPGNRTTRTRSFSVIKSIPEEPEQIPEVATDLEREYEYVRYFLTRNEENFYQKLTDRGKEELLRRWWEDHDPVPDTEPNEFREEIVRRWIHANSVFGGEEKKGWKTDRGRVYIKYGPPDNVERSPITMESNPWSRWEYFELQGGVEFIFGDPRGIGDFELLHSTARGEISDEDWQTELTDPHGPGGSGETE